MMKNNREFRTADIKFLDLCDEIDQWKDQANYYKELYEKERIHNIETSKQNLLDTQKGVVNALVFAFSVKDDENGNLVIDKETRKKLAENYK